MGRGSSPVKQLSRIAIPLLPRPSRQKLNVTRDQFDPARIVHILQINGRAQGTLCSRAVLEHLIHGSNVHERIEMRRFESYRSFEYLPCLGEELPLVVVVGKENSIVVPVRRAWGWEGGE